MSLESIARRVSRLEAEQPDGQLVIVWLEHGETEAAAIERRGGIAATERAMFIGWQGLDGLH